MHQLSRFLNVGSSTVEFFATVQKEGARNVDIVKEFPMNDFLLKNAGGGKNFV